MDAGKSVKPQDGQLVNPPFVQEELLGGVWNPFWGDFPGSRRICELKFGGVLDLAEV